MKPNDNLCPEADVATAQATGWMENHGLHKIGITETAARRKENSLAFLRRILSCRRLDEISLIREWAEAKITSSGDNGFRNGIGSW